MVYFREMQHPKPHQFPSSNLQTFKAKRKTSLAQILLPYCKEYCDESSIHCMRYLTNTKMQKFENAIWILIIAATTFGAIYVYIQLSELYYSQRIQTTVADSVHPIFFIPFPSIAICLRNRVNWPKLKLAQIRFLSNNASLETVETFQRFFERLEDVRFGKFSQLSSLFENVDASVQLSLIDHVNILDVMNFVTFDCTEVFENECYWRRTSYNCCELFTLERTEIGFCHVFNSAVSDADKARAQTDKYYPYHNSKSGEGSGLEVEVKLDKAKMRPGFTSTNGVYIMVKQPEQWHSDVRFINYNTYTKVAITAQLTDTDKRCREVTPEERRCIFEDEHHHPMYKKIPGLLYWRGNCVSRCHQEYIIKYCNCTLSLLFPKAASDNFTDCKPSDFKCIYEHEKIFSSEHHESESEYVDDVGVDTMVCNCLNSCNQLIFINYFTSVALDGVNNNDSIMKVHLDAHFQSPYILKYDTRMRFTFVELLASFGGIIGLFLGASLLSAVELGYFLTIGLYNRLRQEYAFDGERNKVKVIDVKQAKNMKINTKQMLAPYLKEKY